MICCGPLVVGDPGAAAATGGGRTRAPGELTDGVVQEQNAAQQRRMAKLERRVAEAADREQDLSNAAGQQRRQLERQVASLAARNVALEVRDLHGARVSCKRAPATGARLVLLV